MTLIVADINLGALQKDLDAQGLEIVENQKEGLQTRKKLAEQTKEFKKVPDEEKLQQFKALLKAYQSEIDNVTKRSKLAETCFLNLYRLLAEAPDPAPLISAVAVCKSIFDGVLMCMAQDQSKQSVEISALQQENKRLKENISEVERELALVKASESSVTLLKTRLAKYEAKLEEMVTERVLSKEVELKQIMDEKIRIYKETEYSLQRQLNQVKDQLMSLQSSHDITQARLVDHSRQYDEEVAVKLAELEIVLSDLETSNQKMTVLERENVGSVARWKQAVTFCGRNYSSESWRTYEGRALGLRVEAIGKSKCVTADGKLMVYDSPASLQRKLKAQDAEISKLLSELNRIKFATSEKEATLSRRITELERESAVRNLEIAQCKENLARYDDYEQIKKELYVMKLIEFSSKDASEKQRPLFEAQLDEAVDPLVDYSLEKLLMEKVKRYQGDITTLKLVVEETKAELESKTVALDEIQSKSAGQAKLIAKLEEDMYKLNTIVAGSRSSNNSQPPSASPGQLDPILAITTPSPESSLGLTQSSPNIFPPTPSPAIPLSQPSQTNANESASSIVPILASQRDRYRQRNAELEEQLKASQSITAEIKQNLETLQADNIKLYEKLRYAETYSFGGARGSGHPDGSAGNGSWDDGKVCEFIMNPSPTAIQQGGIALNMGDHSSFGPSRRSAPAARYQPVIQSAPYSVGNNGGLPTTSDDVTSRYRTLYDAALDPFQRFHRQEELRRVKDLNPAERGLLTLTRLLAGNRYTRIFFAAYSAALHLLVVATLYMLSQWEECRHGMPLFVLLISAFSPI
ncbi:hypothetical protein HK101_006149 [Irineochytrium annulatum]|nr:hypothetical protein HK101_006149 [Irineochytrium annulatum]